MRQSLSWAYYISRYSILPITISENVSRNGLDIARICKSVSFFLRVWPSNQLFFDMQINSIVEIWPLKRTNDVQEKRVSCILAQVELYSWLPEQFFKKRWQNLSAKTVFSTFCIHLSMLSSLTFLLKNIAFLFAQGLSKISFHRY